MRIELTDEQSARIISAIIDRYLVGGNTGEGTPSSPTLPPPPALSPELRDILAELMSRQSGIFAMLEGLQKSINFLADRQVETTGQLTQFQDQFTRFRGEIMADVQTIINGVQNNSNLIAQAGQEVLRINQRVTEILANDPDDAQLEELQTLVTQQGESLVQIVDTAKQTAPLTPSPETPTPVDGGGQDAPVGGDATTGGGEVGAPAPTPEAPAPTTPDPIVVEPSPVDVGLDGSVQIDAPATETPAATDPGAPAPLF